MADPTDVATAVAAALAEVSVDGVVELKMDGERKVVPIGDDRGGDQIVTVTVEPASKG